MYPRGLLSITYEYRAVEIDNIALLLKNCA